MLSRQYSRKIEVFITFPAPDGYGGNTITNQSIGSFWAEVKQLSSNKDHTTGISDIKTTYSFKVRANSQITPLSNDLSIVYKNKIYVVNDIKYDDELFRFVNIVAHG